MQRLRPSFFYFLFYRLFSQQVSVGGRNKNKNKIHSDHFPIELKSKETTTLINLAAIEKTKRKNITELQYCTGMSGREIQK